MVIYKITNKINKKVYIGQTVQPLTRRFTQHACAKTILGNAIRKYGKDSFIMEILLEVKTLDELNSNEEIYIKKFNSLAPNGYNAAYGGGNRRQTPESRYKLAMAQLGRKHTEETKKKLSIARRKRVTSDATKKKMSLSRSGEKNHKSKINNETAKEINRLLALKVPSTVISKQLQVSVYVVYDIKRGKTWKEI
jgi:group I intron endonuclease